MNGVLATKRLALRSNLQCFLQDVRECRIIWIDFRFRDGIHLMTALKYNKAVLQHFVPPVYLIVLTSVQSRNGGAHLRWTKCSNKFAPVSTGHDTTARSNHLLPVSSVFTNERTYETQISISFPGRNNGRNFSGISALTAVKISHRSRY